MFLLDPLFDKEKLLDIQIALYSRLGIIILLSFRDRIQQVPPDMYKAAAPLYMRRAVVATIHP